MLISSWLNILIKFESKMNVFAQTNSFLYSNTGTPNTQQNNSFASTNINKIGSYRDQ